MKTFILTNDYLGLPSVQIPETSIEWYLEEDMSNSYTLTKDIRSNHEYVFTPTIILRLNELEQQEEIGVEEYNTLTPVTYFQTDSGNLVFSSKAVFKTETKTNYQLDIIGVCSSLIPEDYKEIAETMQNIKIVKIK